MHSAHTAVPLLPPSHHALAKRRRGTRVARRSKPGWDLCGILGQNETCTAPRRWEESPLRAAHWLHSVPGCHPILSRVLHKTALSYDFLFEIRKPRLREIAQGHAFMAGKHSCTCPEILGSSLCSGEGGGGLHCKLPACPFWFPPQSPSPAGPGARAPPTHYPAIGEGNRAKALLGQGRSQSRRHGDSWDSRPAPP